MKSILWILFGAVSIRLLALWLVPEPHLPYNAVVGYLKGAQILLEGEGFADREFPVFTPPLYSVCIAIVAFLFGGDGVFGMKLVQILLDSITAAIIFIFMREAFNRSAAYLSAIIWIVHPFAIYSTLYVGTEALFTCLLALWVFLIVRAINKDSWQLYAAAGAVLGLATLTRGVTQFVPLVLPALLFMFREQNPHWVRRYLLSLACFILIILPWGARNYYVLHEFIPIGANNTVVLWGSYEPLLTIESRDREMPRLLEEAKTKGLVPLPLDRGPAQRDSFLVRLAIFNYLNQLEKDPVEFSFFMLKKFFRVWFATESGNNHAITLCINLLFYVPAVMGVLVVWKRRNLAITLQLCLIGYFTLVHWLTLPLFRYMVPVMPYIIGFAAVGFLAFLKDKWPELYCKLAVD